MYNIFGVDSLNISEGVLIDENVVTVEAVFGSYCI